MNAPVRGTWFQTCVSHVHSFHFSAVPLSFSPGRTRTGKPQICALLVLCVEPLGLHWCECPLGLQLKWCQSSKLALAVPDLEGLKALPGQVMTLPGQQVSTDPYLLTSGRCLLVPDFWFPAAQHWHRQIIKYTRTGPAMLGTACQ